MAIDLTTGRDVALKRTDLGKFDLDFIVSGPGKGNPRLDNTATHAVMTTVYSWKRGKRPGDKVESGGYYYDASGRRGTLLWTITHDTTSARSEFLACADDAGQQLTDEKIITKLTADATRIRLGRWALALRWTTPTADRQETVTL